MLLILDPIHIMAYYHKTDHILDEYKALSLMLLHDELAKIPADYLELVSEIYVINSWSSEFSITKKTKQLFFKLLKEYSESKLLIKLFKKATYEDSLELLDKKAVEFVASRLDKIFFDQTLTKWNIDVLLRTLLNCNTLGFRKIQGKNENKWEEILDVEKYLNIASALTVSPKEIIFSSKENQDLLYKNVEAENEIIYKLMTLSDFKLYLLVNQEDERGYVNFIQNLKQKVGSFAITECSSQGYNIFPNKENIIIKNIQKLPSYKLTELCSEILTGEYKAKRVVIHSTIPIELPDFPEFYGHTLYSLEAESKIYDVSAQMMTKRTQIVENLANDLELYLKETTLKTSEFNRGLKKITDLKSVSDVFDTKKANFWYNLNSVNYPTYEDYANLLLEQLDNYFKVDEQNASLDKSIKIKIVHDIKFHKWSIEINDEKIKTISYQNSIGMKYLVYLIKHYRDGDFIEDNVLQEVVLKWHNKGNVSKKKVVAKNKLSKPAAHSIDQALNYLFTKQCPELTPLKRYIHITANEPGCWYENNLFIDCEVTDDQIPPKKV